MKWYQNRYVQAAAVATATGSVTAIILGLHLLTQPISTKEFISEVGLAFMGPFAALVALLPRISEILTPTVRIVGGSGTSVHELQAATAEEETVVTSEPVTTVVVGPRPRLRKNPDAHMVPVIESEAGKGAVT